MSDTLGESDLTKAGKPTVMTEMSAVSTARTVLVALNRSIRSERSNLVPQALHRLAAGLIGSQQIGHVELLESLDDWLALVT